VLVVGPDSPHVNTFVKRLLVLGFKVEVISSGNTHIEFPKIHNINFSLTKIRNYFKNKSRIRKIAAAFNPDVVWTHQANSYSFFPVLALRNKYPIVLTVWGSDVLVAPKKSILIRKMTNFILNNVNLIAADSVYLASETKKMIKDKSIPFHSCQFGFEPLEIAVDKAAYIYSNRGHKELYRIASIIKAFGHYKKKHPDTPWKLIVAGEGSETPLLIKMAKDLGCSDNIVFVGFLNHQENARWYAESTFYVSVPESDGTAVSLLEAMYYGCIPIVSDLPANHEWIQHGKNGFVVEDVQDEFFSQALSFNYGNVAEINRGLIENVATPEACCGQIQNVLESLLSK
jgi:glycosyltransferase involved in cell wall biosynthesis